MPHLVFQGDTLTPQDKVELLGVTYDSKLIFRTHIEWFAREASGKLASLRRISHLLDSRGMEVSTRPRFTLPWSTHAWHRVVLPASTSHY